MYSRKLSEQTLASVRATPQAWIEESQGLQFDGKSQHMALSPWPGWPTTGFLYNKFHRICTVQRKMPAHRSSSLIGLVVCSLVEDVSVRKAMKNLKDGSRLELDLAALSLMTIRVPSEKAVNPKSESESSQASPIPVNLSERAVRGSHLNDLDEPPTDSIACSTDDGDHYGHCSY